MIKFLLTVIVLAILGTVGYAWWRTYKTEHSENQAKFVKGTATTANLDGGYKGKAAGYEGSWQGKSFNKADNSGINRFNKNGNMTTDYPFKTYVAKGLRDTAVDVIKLDYNQPQNPWWLRLIMDEMVEVSPQHYLGKVHFNLAPGLVFSIGYFTLEKE